LFILVTLTTFSFASEPPKDPILRIDAGAHSASIKALSVDAAGKTVLTCSHDKTARLYDIETGTLLKVFRPPIAAGYEGKLYACALSPDGRTVAVGGYTGWAFDRKLAIYIFNASTGNLMQRIAGLKSVINRLAFSDDGRTLAASLGGKNGIRVFRVADGTELGRDADYAGDSHSVHFAPDGRLVSTSYDGYLRLYNRSLDLIKKIKTPDDKMPFVARFTPDGRRISVGYSGSHTVDVFSGTSLKHLFAPDTKGVDDQLTALTWSADGQTLYAGGLYNKKIDGEWQNPVLSWDNGGRGTPQEHTVGAKGTLQDLAYLDDGRILFGGSDPVFGTLSPNGESRLIADAPTADYVGLLKNLKISNDGMTVKFKYLYDYASPGKFNVQQQQLSVGPTDAAKLLSPRITADEFTVTNWKHKFDPKLNDSPLKLKQYEKSHSLAIAPDEQKFVLGANWSIRCYDTTGKKLWQKPTPGTAWAVNITLNGQIVVAAYGDGTIRWHRLSDGEELLALFAHADQKRWVLWTPSGYYAASSGGEELIGWHVNNGKDNAADFFPASRFRASRYRPDIVALVLETFDEKTAIATANTTSNRRESVELAKLLPPVVTITSHRNGSIVSSEELDLNVSVRSPSGTKVTGMKVLVDGRPVTRERGISLTTRPDSDTHNLRVTIPPRDCEVSVIAETASTTSVPATVRLSWAGEKPKQKEFVAKPKLYILAVGVSQYEDKELTLGFAAKDAKDFAAALKKQQGGLYREVVTKVLTDELATKDDVLDGLDWLESETTSRDVAMLFIAGHGLNDKNGTYYYLPQNTNLNRLKRTGVPFYDIKTTLAGLAGKALFFVDTCHSGNVMGGRRAAPTDINGLVNELSSAENGAVVFASSTGRQYSLEDPKWGNGAFTKALVEGLSGKADYTGEGKISINMLDLYLSERVKKLTNGKQTPTTTKPQTISDFPVAVKL
jgi:WD40 repeat protein